MYPNRLAPSKPVQKYNIVKSVGVNRPYKEIGDRENWNSLVRYRLFDREKKSKYKSTYKVYNLKKVKLRLIQRESNISTS